MGLLFTTALLYLWDLGASGWANSYYSAAVQAGSQSWKAFFFGSFDASNSITVDKAPAFLWPMELSARIFGVNTWSMLVPEALMGVATVGLVYAAIRRWFSPAAGLIAGVAVALTPVATLMFRFNNPDAMLVLLLTAAAYATMRALEKAETKWVLAVGGFVGFAFLAKMFQAFLVVPGFGFAYLVAAPTTIRRRLVQLLGALAAMVLSGGWWVAIVSLWPAGSRPYIGGSQDNSLLNLIFGYNGFGRLTGNESGSVGGGANAGGNWGPTGITRLFNSSFGGQASWLLPAALVMLASVLLLTIKTPRTARTRAAMLVWGGWLLVTAVAFSFGQGIIHQYYTVALAPPIGAIIGIGATALWARRRQLAARLALVAALGATTAWSAQLLHRTSSWHPELRIVVLVAGLATTLALVFLPLLPTRRSLWTVVGGTALGIGLIGPGAYSLATAAQPHTGAIPTAGPTGASQGGPGGAPGATARTGVRALTGTNGAAAPATNAAATAGAIGAPGGGTVGTGGVGGAGGLGGAGGILNASTPSAELVATLDANADQYTWIAATVSANQAAGYQLATGDPVMAIGGFNGTDPSPTLAQFQADVAAHKIHYFIAGNSGGRGGQSSSGTASAITTWVQSNFTATTVGTATLYDLSI